MLGITETGGVVGGENMGVQSPDTAFMTPEQKKKAAQLKMLGGLLMTQEQVGTKSNAAGVADIGIKALGGYLAGGGNFDFLKKKKGVAPMDAGVSPIGNYGANGFEGVA